MDIEEGWSFSLPEPPTSVCYSPSTNSVIACRKDGKINCYDLLSGQQLCETDAATESAKCTFNLATGKLVILNDKCLGARKDFNGAYLLESILQPTQDDQNAPVVLEIPLSLSPDLFNELQTLVGKKNTIVISAKEKKVRNIKQEKWTTCCIKGAHKSLLKDFVQPNCDNRTSSITRPVLCQLKLRLMLLGAQHNTLSKYESGKNSENFSKQSSPVYCEAVRRYSFMSWPHKNYVWAVPDTMAAAGFFLAAAEQHHYGSYSMADRTLCFCCNVSLHRWEPTDEPWSEHERHSSKCAFIRGEYTDNVSIAYTEATHPAQRFYTSDAAASEVCCVSTTADGVGLVAVGHSDGLITVWDLSKHLMLWKACSLHVDITSITYALATLLENGGTTKGDSTDKKQDFKEEEKLEEVTEDQKQNTQEKEQQHNKQVEDKELQNSTQQEEPQLDNQQQQQQEDKVEYQQTQQVEAETQLDKEQQPEKIEQQQKQQSQEDTRLEKHGDDCGQENEQNEVQQEDKKKLVENEQQQKDTITEQEQEPQQQGEDQQEKQQVTSHPNEEREQPQQDSKTEDVAQTINATDKPSTTQINDSSPVESCKLHSLSIVHSLTPTEKDSNKDTNKSASNKDTSSNVIQEASLLTGVSFTKDDKKDAAIIAYAIPSKYEGEGGAAGKSKQKSYQPPSTAVEGMNDLFLGLDEIPIIPPPPINVDLDTPSWQLAPPAIPAAPPPPPVKSGTPVKKLSGARHLQTFLISENIDNLPDDASPVVSALQPCGHTQVAAAIEYGPDHGGCVILFNLNNFYNQTVIGDSIIYEFKTPLEHVTSMCAIEKPDTDGTGSSHYIATIDKGGSLVIYNDDTGKLKQMVTLTPTDSYVSCFSCINVGLLGVVTKSGKVVTIRVVTSQMVTGKSDGDAVYGSDIKESSPSLNPHQAAFQKPLTADFLQSCHNAVQFSPANMPFKAFAPPNWDSISMEQLYKKSPQHVCYSKRQAKGSKDIPPLTWQYNVPVDRNSSDASQLDDAHSFDLCFALKKNFGHLDVTLILYHPEIVNQDTLISLVLNCPKASFSGSSIFHNGDVVCGPVRLQHFIDITGNTATIKFSHPELIKQQNCICTLVIENLSSNLSEIKKTTTPDTKLGFTSRSRFRVNRNSLMRKERRIVHYSSRSSGSESKTSGEKRLAIMIKVYPFAKTLTESDLDLHRLLIDDVVCHESLILVVTRYQVVNSELDNLSPCLRTMMDNLQQSGETVFISEQMCYQALDLLCWIAGVLLYDKVRVCVFLKSVGGLLSSLLYICFLDEVSPVSLPQKLLRLLHLCGRSELIDPAAHSLFIDQLLNAMLAMLPLVSTMSYKGALQLFFHILSSHVGPYRQLEVLRACRDNLCTLTPKLQVGTELLTQLLRAEFDLPVIRSRSLLTHPPPVSLPLGLDTMTADSRYYTNERHSDDSELQLLINASESVLGKPSSDVDTGSASVTEGARYGSGSLKSYTIDYYDGSSSTYAKESTKLERGIRNPFFARRFSTTLLETLTLAYSFKSFSHASISVVEKALPSKKEVVDLESLLVGHENGLTVGYNPLPPDTAKDLRNADYVPKGVEDLDNTEDADTPRTLFTLFDLPCLMRSKQILIEGIESGVGYSIVLDLERSTELTNICLNTSHHRIGSVIVDVWGENETEESAVRLVQTTDVKSKSITVGSLLPAPICRYLKITFVIALGANRESIQFPIGILFGRPLCAIERPLSCQLVQEIQHRLKCKCYTVQSSLAPLVSLYLNQFTTDKHQQQVLKSMGLAIRELYEACRNAEIQLDRFKRVVIERQDRNDSNNQPRDIDLIQKAKDTKDVEVNRYEIIAQYLVSACIVILGQKSTLSQADNTDDDPATLPTSYLPLILDPRFQPEWCLQFSYEECHTLFYSLCVHGVAEEQVRLCVLLVQACGVQQWWSSFITNTFLDLFRSNPDRIFSKEKVFLIISTMIQKTLSVEMLSSLLEAAGKLLIPQETDHENTLDMEQIEWLLFLFSHMLSSVGATSMTQSGIILPGSTTSSFNSTATYAHKLNEIENQIKEKQNRIEHLDRGVGQSTGDKSYILKKVQEIKEQAEREKVALREDASMLRKRLDEMKKQESDDTTVNSLAMLSAVTDDIKQQLARGIMFLIVSYIDGNVSIDAVLGACSTLTLLVDSCSTSLQLSCLLTGVQFHQLLTFCISWQSMKATGTDPQHGKLQWMCRSVVSLISNLIQNEYISYLKHISLNWLPIQPPAANPDESNSTTANDKPKEPVSKEDKVEIKSDITSSDIGADSGNDETDSSKLVSIPVSNIFVASAAKSTSDSDTISAQKLSSRLAGMSVYSSAVDHRLIHTFNLLAEKDYQRLTNAEFEHVVTAIRHSGNTHHSKLHSISKGKASPSLWKDFDIYPSRQTADMLTETLSELLSKSQDPFCSISLVDVLEFWNSLVAIELSKIPTFSLSREEDNSSDVTVDFFSSKLVESLLDYLANTSSPIVLQTWQLVFSFIKNILVVKKYDCQGADYLLNSDLFAQALVKFLTHKWSTSPLVEPREESSCLLESSFKAFLAEVESIVCVNQDLPVVCGLQFLMDVLSKSLRNLFQSGGGTFTVMLFAEYFSGRANLTKSLSSLKKKPAQKLLRSFSELFLNSIQFVKSYLSFSQRDQFELRGTESRMQRHHYMRGDENVMWFTCQNDSHYTGKLCSLLLQSIRQLCSETNITEQALEALALFTAMLTGGSEMDETQEVVLSYTVREHPFLEVLFSNEELLYKLLTTLNSNISAHTLLSKPKAAGNTATVTSSSFVLHIFQNFAQFLVSNCTNMSCFLKPSLRCLQDSLSSHSKGYSLSSLIANILTKIFDAPSNSTGKNEQLVQFFKLGGADLVFQGLIRSCQFNKKVGKSIFSTTMAHVTKTDPLQPTSKDGSLTNFATLATVQLLNSDGNTTQTSGTTSTPQLQGLVSATHTYSSSRSANLVTTDAMFVNGWLNLVLKFPYPILLYTVQVFCPSSSSYANSSPTMMALGILHQSNNSPALPVVSPIICSGTHCQELKLSQPKPTQEVVVYLKRPASGGQLSLSQITALGSGLLTDNCSEENSNSIEHPSTGWLNLLCDWMLSSCGEEVISPLLEQAKSQTSTLVDASLKFIQESTNLELCHKMEQVLVFLYTNLEEFRTGLLRQLMGISSGRLQSAPPTSSIAIQLLYKLCVNSPDNILFSAIGWLSQLPMVSKLPAAHIRAIASAVWLRRGQDNLELHLSQDTFSSLLEYTISLEVASSTKSAMCSLLCAVCAMIPSYFATFIKSTRHLYENPDDLDSKLLYCTAVLCNNNGCLNTLLESGAVTIICERLTVIFSELNSIAKTAVASEESEDAISSLIIACRLLAFLTQLISNHLAAKNWLLETENVCDFWNPLMEYLVYNHKAYNRAKNIFFLRVVVKFFRECLCLHAASKVKFVKLLLNLMTTSSSDNTPTMTPLLYELLVTFIFNMEYISVILNVKEAPPGVMFSQHLVHTYDSQQFHPSHSISASTFIMYCPASTFSLGKLQDRFLIPTGGSKPSGTPAKQESHLGKKGLDYNAPTPDMFYLYNNDDDIYGSFSSKAKGRSKTGDNKSDKSELPLLQHKLEFSLDDKSLHPDIKLSELLHHCSCNHLPLVLDCSVVDAKAPTQSTVLTDSDLKKSPECVDTLNTFIEEGGLPIISKCLPFLYKHFWPKEEVYGHWDKSMLASPDEAKNSLLRPHVLPSLPSCIPFHSLFMLGLSLRIKFLSQALSDMPSTFMLLRALLGIESGISQDLTLEPYNKFQSLLGDNAVGTDVGNSLREEVFAAGVAHHLLHCLSLAGHHPVRCKEKDSTISSSPVFKMNGSIGVSSSQTNNVTVESKQYWAKGTGFGTGSVNSKWNMKETVSKQQQEEALVTTLFEVLGKYFKVPGGVNDVHCFSAQLYEVCANSCLLPGLASYLHNDSVLDMSKHVTLYMSVMRLVQGISSNQVLRPLLLLNYSSSEEPTSGHTLTKLLAQLKETVTKYCKTVKIGDKTKKVRSSSDTELGSTEYQTGPPLPPRDDGKSKEKGSLNELIASIKVTCELVANMAQELKHQESDDGKELLSARPTQTVDEAYMETMKPLQFDTYCMVEEDEDGQHTLHVPYYYQDKLLSTVTVQMSATKARRLAQEIASLSTSLPLSPSSSVFVKCDAERLDVMKVLITGPADTPYANGCFLCDVFFPPEYPSQPMLVNLATTGNNTVRFNPNLYADGKVCLSILNTWQGRPEEKWNAQTSSFLQVLVSIQSLILVPEPYFNEPGYEQYRGSSYGNKRCIVYNGELYCNTMKWAIIEQIRNPDPCFKEVIYRHYHARRDKVLEQCKNWKTELESAIEVHSDDAGTLKQLKTQLSKITQLLPSLQQVLYKSIDLSEFDAKQKESEDEESKTNEEENS